MKVIRSFLKDEAGQSLVEYGLLIGILVVGTIVAMSSFGLTIKEVLYDNLIKKLTEIVSNL